MKTKFNTSINTWYMVGVVIFNLIIILLITSRFYLQNTVVSNYGVLCLIVDAVLIIPMMILTRYELTDGYIIIHEYPIKKHKIKYEDIFTIEDGDFEVKSKKIVALSMDRLIIGYTDEDEKKQYIAISPNEMNLFLIKLGGKLKDGKELAEKKAAEISAKQEEHLKKKKQWQKKKTQLEMQNKPEIIEANGIKKFDAVKIQKIEDSDRDKEE